MDIDFSKDYYAVLGVSDKATKEEIASAYRKMMLQWHPDKFASKGKEEQDEATKRSAEINEAYDVLGDEDRRRSYDMARGSANAGFGAFGGFNADPFGGNPFENGPFGFNFGNPFHNPFGGAQGFHRRRENRTPTDGRRVTIRVELPFEDFFFGCVKTLDVKVSAKCDDCNGGIIGDSADIGTCPYCGGKGFSSHVEGGNVLVHDMCRHCNGTGNALRNACTACGGTGIRGKRVQTLKFEVPKDTRGHWTQTYHGVGMAGMYGGSPGDIVVEATVSSSGMFYHIHDNDIGTIHYVNVFKAIAGGYETILTPYGEKTVMLPSETYDGMQMQFNGMGLKGRSDGERDGNLLVTFKIDFPKGLTETELKSITKMAAKFDENPKAFPNVLSEKGYVGVYMSKLKEK